MDLLSIKTIKNLLLKHDTRPLKRMGQNFLVDKAVFDKIIEVAQLTSGDTVLEIGPGIGNLTKELAQKAKRVITIEKDRVMIEILKETLKGYDNVEVIEGNALTFDPKKYHLDAKKYKIVANIPYYITSPLIRKFLESKCGPTTMILMVQKEVAQRICSTSPSPSRQNSKRTYGVGAGMSLLSVSVQFYAKVKVISYISKESFWPSPKVDSAILTITPEMDIDQKKIDVDLFFKIVRAGFSQKRKQLANNLSKSLGKNKNEINSWLLKNEINPEQRAETLSINDWENLTKNYEHL